MGNSKSKKVQKEPDRFFDRERWKEHKREEIKKKNINQKRAAVKDPPVYPSAMLSPPTLGPGPTPEPAHIYSYDDVALDRMRYQLNNDSDAFLLNNILLSVQFFENYEREVHQIKNNPVSERQHIMDEAMVRHHKHVFFADRIQECVQDHIVYKRRPDLTEPLVAPRLFIIYDNVEASEPGDTSDYSAVLDAPFYKLRIEDSKVAGFIKLKKLEILESTHSKEIETNIISTINCADSVYTDSEKESNASDDPPYSDKRADALQRIKTKSADLHKKRTRNLNNESSDDALIDMIEDINIKDNDEDFPSINNCQETEFSFNIDDKENVGEQDIKPRKSILKHISFRRHSDSTNEILNKSHTNANRHISLENIIAEDTETSGYRSNASSRQTESSETESDYGYSTITESTTPKKIELSFQTNYSTTSGVLPDESWINLKPIETSDEEDEDEVSLNGNFYENNQYLSSITFMNHFVDNFIVHLGFDLGFSQDTVKNALTQGASVYCSATKNGSSAVYEVFPALLAAWPTAANPWIIRERKIIQNPRNNYRYQWPTKYMVSKSIGFGCVLVPIGFRPKRGVNPRQKLQWKVVFPAAERYLESCLAHSHMRCYLFALVLHKAFMENETSKIGIDASHIKNHLFWQCEDNYARWPEDRLGESLRLFLKSFYFHFGKSRFPNYFIENCNEFKSIPKPLLLKLQRKLADILESPVTHLLHAIQKLKYTKKDFYPALNCHKLYEILTCKNPLRILNPNLPIITTTNVESSDSDDDRIGNIWDKAKAHDKRYQRRKEKRQLRERRQAQMSNKKQKKSVKEEREINKSIVLPTKLEPERRRLVLEFFIPHFIEMARSSEKFDALRQAFIYLEQAQRLCYLLREEPAGDITASEYLVNIRDRLNDCHRKLVNQEHFKLSRDKGHAERNSSSDFVRRQRPKFEHIINQNSPSEVVSKVPFTFADVHVENNNKFLDVNGKDESKM